MTTRTVAMVALTALALAACGDSNTPAPKAASAPVADAPVASASRAAASAGDLASLKRWIGKYPTDTLNGRTFYQEPALLAALTPLLSRAQLQELTNPGPTGPILDVDGRIALWSCRKDDCGDVNQAIVIDPAKATTVVCFHDQVVDGPGVRWFAADLPGGQKAARTGTAAGCPADEKQTRTALAQSGL